MGVMLGEEITTLTAQVRALTKQRDTFEADKDRVAGLLRDEKAAHHETARRAEQAEAQNHSMRVELDRVRHVAQQVEQDRQARSDAEAEAETTAKRLAKATGDLEKLTAKHDATVLERDGLKRANTDLEHEIGPVRTLLAALSDQRRAEDTISAELQKLGR